MNPLVSIVMPCFNSEKYLRHALISVQNQSYGHYQLIVINDGSSDATERLLMEFDSNRLIYIKNEQNEGVAASLNKGLSVAAGEYIARFDADDFMYPQRIQEQVSALLECDEIGIIGSGADVFGDITTVYRPGLGQDDVLNQMTLNNPLIHPTIMFRRELYDSGLFKYRTDLSTEEDYELWCRIIPRVQVRNIQSSLIRYRIHGSNNQRIPGKLAAKKIALATFFQNYEIFDAALVETLANFQCSGYISYDGYRLLHDYAKRADKMKLPKLAWLHAWIAKEKRYSVFMDYYMSRQWEIAGAL